MAEQPRGAQAADDGDLESLRKEAEALAPWQYRYALAPGVTTPNSDEHHEWNVARRRLLFGLLDGVLGREGYASRSFLDGGCNAGLWSFELHRRGARRVDAFDARPENIRKCELVQRVRGIPADEVRFRVADLYDMESLYEPHDVVLALGFMYHLSNPIEVARQLGRVTRELLVVDSNVNTLNGSVCVYRPEDPSLHHNGVEPAVMVPNRNALVGMLRDAGFETVLQVQPPAWMPPMYREGRRVLLLASKAPGPAPEDAF